MHIYLAIAIKEQSSHVDLKGAEKGPTVTNPFPKTGCFEFHY